MEYLLSLRKAELLEQISDYPIGGVITGLNVFSTAYAFTKKDLVKIAASCHKKGLALYIVIDSLLKENELAVLKEYLLFLKSLNIQGIYYHDLAVLKSAQAIKLNTQLIYDGGPLLTNSLDVAFHLHEGNDAVVLARELTLKEIKRIAKANRGQVDLQICGHLRLARSGRLFLSNYFSYLKREYPVKNREDLTIVEEKRDYRLPIYENNYGTEIYSDYIFLDYAAWVDLAQDIRHGIIDSLFLDDALLLRILNDLKSLKADNALRLQSRLAAAYPEETFASAYLLKETNITKPEGEYES